MWVFNRNFSNTASRNRSISILFNNSTNNIYLGVYR